jgi:Protein of unknown function (DUF1153)
LADEDHRVSVPFFIGPDGEQITFAQLPPRELKSWLPRHKAIVVAAVRNGLLTFDEACRRYGPYAEEYLSWHDAVQRGDLHHRG